MSGAAWADEITAAVIAATEPGADVKLIVSGQDWRVCVSTLTDLSCAIMPCGADGETRSGRRTRELGCATSRYELSHHQMMLVISRSRRIHRAERAAFACR